jgi:hypothetical protein
MRRSCHFDRFGVLEGQRGRPADPKKVSVGCTRPDAGKTVVTLMKTALFSLFWAYFTLSNSVKRFSRLVVTRTQPGSVEPRETPTPHELATSDRDTRLSLRLLSGVWLVNLASIQSKSGLHFLPNSTAPSISASAMRIVRARIAPQF